MKKDGKQKKHQVYEMEREEEEEKKEEKEEEEKGARRMNHGKNERMTDR